MEQNEISRLGRNKMVEVGSSYIGTWDPLVTANLKPLTVSPKSYTRNPLGFRV